MHDMKNFEKRWAKARTKAGLEDVKFTDLRHTCATYVLNKTNGNLKVVQAVLRHSDYRMTERYAQLAPTAVRQAILTLDDAFAGVNVPGSAPEVSGDISRDQQTAKGGVVQMTDHAADHCAPPITQDASLEKQNP